MPLLDNSRATATPTDQIPPATKPKASFKFKMWSRLKNALQNQCEAVLDCVTDVENLTLCGLCNCGSLPLCGGKVAWDEVGMPYRSQLSMEEYDQSINALKKEIDACLARIDYDRIAQRCQFPFQVQWLEQITGRVYFDTIEQPTVDVEATSPPPARLTATCYVYTNHPHDVMSILCEGPRRVQAMPPPEPVADMHNEAGDSGTCCAAPPPTKKRCCRGDDSSSDDEE